MAASALLGLISAGTTALTGGTLLGGFLVGGAGTFFTHFLVTTAMGVALNALTPKPNLGGTGGFSIRGESGAALDHQIIYGEARVGGARIYDSTSSESNQFLHRILAFAGHKIDSYQEIYLNDEVVAIDTNTNLVTSPSQYAGKVFIKQYLGDDDQLADADLIQSTALLDPNEGKWTSDHRLQGIAYLYVRFEYDSNAFPNGVPAVSAKIRGKAVFDPRTSLTVWSDNPALCIRDYLTSEHGLNQPNARIDDTLVVTAANICDQTTESEKRYTCNGAFTTRAEPSTIVTNLLTSMGGLLWYGQGKWRMKAASWTTPTVSFDENDLRSPISLSTRHSRRDNFNSVKGTFAGDETDWQVTDYPEVTDPAFLVADNNVPNVLDFPLPFTSSALTAQRLARISLNRNREQLTFSAAFGMRAFQVQVGDFVNITNTRFGWDNKAFEIVEWTLGLQDSLEITVNMTLREISEGVFTGADGSTFEGNNTLLPSASSGLTINNLTASGGGATQGDGTFINSVILDWDDVTNVFVDHYEVDWKVKTDSVYSSTTTEQSGIEIIPVVDGRLYEFRVRAVTVGGVKGAYATVEFTGGGDETAPGLPTSVTATGGFKYITIQWENPADADLNYVEIWEANTNNSGAATRIGTSGGNNFQRTNLGISVTKWYFLKAVDYSGNASAFTAGVSATTTFIDDEDFAEGIYSLFTEQGLYAIQDVTNLPPSGDFAGQKVFNRTDGKLYQWTGSAWEQVVGGAESFADLTGQIAQSQIPNGTIDTAQIAEDAITAGKVSANAIGANAIAANAITSDKILAGSITGDRITANTITGGLLATSGVITNSAQINNAVITNAKIGNAAVDTLKIAGESVTVSRFNGPNTFRTSESGPDYSPAFVSWVPAYSGQALIQGGGLFRSEASPAGYFTLRFIFTNPNFPSGGIIASETIIIDPTVDKHVNFAYVINTTAGFTTSVRISMIAPVGFSDMFWTNAWVSAFERFR